MLNSKGFDLWSEDYDKSVNISEEAEEYPFAGYRKLLNTIYSRIKSGEGDRVLDIGFGTGILSKKLYDDGYSITGIDFSEKMVETAQKKMPEALLVRHDFTQGLPASLKDSTFDFIICTYAIHHLNDTQKISFIKELKSRLSSKGRILIGDVAFSSEEELERCRVQSEDRWDTDEIYPVLETLRPAFPNIKFEKISFCAGIFTLER